MSKIEGTTIKVNRGDALSLTLSVSYTDGTAYTFASGDTVVFSVYNKNQMSGNAVFMKTINVSTAGTTLPINLTGNDTKFGSLIDKPVEYWYEFELNNQYTILGYDDSGPKKLMLYPEGSKIV